jgi:hypothetical protein
VVVCVATRHFLNETCVMISRELFGWWWWWWWWRRPFFPHSVSLFSLSIFSVIKKVVWSHEKRLARPTQIPEKIEKRTREEETSTVNKYNIIPTIPVWFHTRNIYQRWFCWERKTVRCADLKRKSFRFDDDDDGGNRSRVMMIRLFIYL